jgi:hypothetical protein
MRGKVRERERNWEGRNKEGEVPPLIKSQWRREMESEDGWLGWENLDEETETENKAAARVGQEEDTNTEEEMGLDWEAVLAEMEIDCLAGQFPQAAIELAESLDGSEVGEKQGAEQERDITSQSGREGQARPPTEADRLLQEEEERERTLVDWRAVEETAVQQGEEEDLDEPSLRIKEEWLSKRDNPWDTQDREWLRAQLYAPRKEQIAGRCVLEHHLKVWKETCGGAAFMEKGMCPYWTDADSPARLKKLPPAYEHHLKAKEEMAFGRMVADDTKEEMVV